MVFHIPHLSTIQGSAKFLKSAEEKEKNCNVSIHSQRNSHIVYASLFSHELTNFR